MKKRAIGILITGVLVLVFLSLVFAVSAVDATVVKVDPDSQAVKSGDAFSVNVTVENVTYMGADQAKLNFDPGAMSVTGVTEGDFLKSAGTTFPVVTINNNNGYVVFSYALLTQGIGVTGSGTLATIYIDTNASAECTFTLNLTDVMLADGDGDGITVDEISNGTVKLDNTPPTVDILSPANGTWFDSEPVNVIFHAWDNKAELLNYTVFVDDEELANGTALSGDNTTVNLGILPECDRVIRVNVTDDAGLEGSDEVIIHVDLTPPTVEIISPEDGANFFDSEEVWITFHPWDNKADVLDYIIYDNGTEVANGTAANCTEEVVNLGILPECDHVIKVEVTDRVGKTGSAEITVYVGPTPPNATITSPTTQSFHVGQPILFNSSVTGGSSPYTYTWTSSKEGSIGNTSSFNCSTLSIGTHTITLIVADSDNKTATDTITLIISGTDLSITSPDITFSNSWPSQDESITIYASAHNEGDENVQNVSVKFYDEDIYIGEAILSQVSYHSTGNASIQYAPGIAGYRLIKVVVDGNNNITESNENNNEATRPIAVGSGDFYGGIELTGSVETPCYTGEYVRVYGNAIYNTTYDSGSAVAGAEVSITIEGLTYTTYTTSSGTYSKDIVAPYTTGNYQIVVRITDTTFVAEYRDLMLKVEPWPQSYPDLLLQSINITFSTPKPVQNNSATVYAEIRNIGGSDASDVLVSFYDDGKLISTQTISTLPKGGTSTPYVSWTPSYYNVHTITVRVDENHVITEVNDNNNDASEEIYVYPDLPDFTPIYVWCSDFTPAVNQSQTLYAYIKNIGGIGGTAKVSFYDNNVLVCNTTVNVNGKDGYALTSITHTFDSPSYHTVKVIVNPDHSPVELNYNNNEYSRTYYVHTPLPDMYASSITSNNSEPIVGDTVQIYANIYNRGEADACNVTVHIYDGALLLHNITIPLLQVAHTQQLSTAWIPSTYGWHTLQVKVDQNNDIAESREYNNIGTEYRYVYPQLVDLVAVNLTFSQGEVEVYQNVNITATVKNMGGADAEDVQIGFYDNGALIAISNVTIPAKGESINKTITHSFAESGTHAISIKADPDNTTTEADETNNEFSRNISVLPPSPDLSVLSIAFNNSTPIHGDVVNITATIQNSGKADVSNVLIRFYNDNVGIGDKIISVANNTNELVSLDWISIGGDHRIKVYADPGNAIVESNEKNNYRTKYIHVRAPDIQVLSEGILFNNTNPDINETVKIYGNVTNIGTLSASNITVKFYVDDILIAQQTIAMLAEGSYIQLNTTWKAQGRGSHVVKISAIFDSFYELSKSNNDATRGLVVGKAPDLSITSDDITISPDKPVEGEVVTITAIVHNTGEENVTATVFFYDPINSIGANGISVPANSTDTATIGWVAEYGVTELYVLIANSYPPESNETNNRATKYITVTLPPQLNITYAQTDNTTYNLNENVTISCIVQNETGANITADNVTAEILKPDSLTEWITLSEGLTGNYNGTFTNTSLAGTYNMTVYANKSGYITDTAEINFEVISIVPPIANFTYSPAYPLVNQTITFNASNSTDPDGTITKYEWHFGDGVNGTGEVVTYSYPLAGEYNVNLTITDDEGAKNSTNKTIAVRSKPTFVKVIPETQEVSAGSPFLMNITVENVTYMGANQATLNFDSIAMTVSSVTEGAFLKSAGPTMGAGMEDIDNVNGSVTFFYTLTTPGIGVSGNGTLATIYFDTNASAKGMFNLNLSGVMLADGDGNAIPVDVVSNGTVNLHFNVTITSPENRTYASACVRLNFTVEPEGTTLDWIGYSLDGGANVTIPGNTTVNGLSACGHNIVVYARDTHGNMAASNTVYFTLYPGDINGDGVVNVFDLQRLAWAFNSYPTHPDWNENADLNCDNKVNVFDLQLLAWNFGNDYTVICVD